MIIPDKIYLQVCGDCPQEDCENCSFDEMADGDGITWCRDRIFEKDKEYISKDALYKWAKAKKDELLKEENPTDVTVGIHAGMEMLINKLNSL